MTEPVTLAELRTIDLFDELDDADLQRWVDATVVRDLEPDEVFVGEGELPEGLLLLLQGTAEVVLIDDEGREDPMGLQVAPTWVGAIPLLTDAPLGGRMRAATPLRLGIVPTEDFLDLALSQRAVHRRVMAAVRPVTERMAQREQNRERLASLGTMAAGLAHELNNPAAAAQRAAADLADALDVIGSTIGRFVESGIERADAACLVELQREAVQRAASCSALDALDAADAEDDLTDHLEQLGVTEPWRLAEPLGRARVDRAWLDEVHRLAGPATDAALRWVAATLTASTLAAELQESTAQMSRLVAAVKTYAYMDRGGVVDVDIHEGIETTLVVLGHKLKHTSIEVVRAYDRTLPKVTVRASELNQVWTNLLDNAIGALGDQGTITITTRRDGTCLEVDVADDGPGIADDVRDRVFDPFFTTKDVGSGTGLGLDTARRIVTERHRGSLTLAPAPAGGTIARVRLPLEATAR